MEKKKTQTFRKKLVERNHGNNPQSSEVAPNATALWITMTGMNENLHRYHGNWDCPNFVLTFPEG